MSGDVPAPATGAAASQRASEAYLPDIPDEYFRFKGRVVEVHALDDSAGAAFEEIFGRARFEAAFPAAAAAKLPALVGLDLEWRPDRRQSNNSGPGNPIALVQLASWDAVLLARTTGCRTMPPWLASCLEDSSMVKVSASFDFCDKGKLKHTFGWDFAERVGDPGTFLDIADLAKERGLPYGLKRLANACGAPMLKPKEVGCSNWAAEDDLSDGQRQYAAEDAFFTLYLLGHLYEKQAPADAGRLDTQAFSCWREMRTAMAGLLEKVDNRVYKRCFFELRDVVKEAVASLSKALGSGGSTTHAELFRVKSVEKALKAAQKQCAISLNTPFLRANEDIFVLFFDTQARAMKVRPRRADEEDEYNEVDEEELEFVARALDRLAAYEPPSEKRQSVTHRLVPEALQVPARAILSAKEQARWEKCADRYKDSVETTRCPKDGLVLKLLRHPRAADADAHQGKCFAKLQEVLGIDAEESRRRLLADEKFVQFGAALRTIERDTDEEVAAVRSLRARARILADAELVGRRVNVGWEAAREALEKVKPYRQTLGAALADVEGDEPDDSEVREVLDAVVEAWPNVEAVARPKKRPRDGGDGGHGAKRARGGKDGGKGKGKGKGKEKGRGGAG